MKLGLRYLLALGIAFIIAGLTIKTNMAFLGGWCAGALWAMITEYQPSKRTID